MKFDFDKVVNRRNTHSAKWDAMGAATGVTAKDGIAMWVADMDFEAPPAVKEALLEEVNRSVHGYYANDITWRTAMSNFLHRHHNWQPDPDHIIPTPGVVSALGMVLQAVSQKDDSVVVFSPVYHAFGKIIKANERQMFSHSLINEQGRYKMDLDGLAKTIPDNAKVVFFCSPHNPGGTVWSKEEIEELANFCVERDLYLVSDEVHHDLVYSEAKHHVTATTAPQIEDKLFTCVAASKTFNLAGAHVGGMIISNNELRIKFKKIAAQSGLLSYPLFGMIASETAQVYGDEWLAQLIPYLQANRDLIQTSLPTAIKGCKPMILQSTYLAWIDFSQVDLPMEEVNKRVFNDAHIAASPGIQFGKEGQNSLRFNFATPKSLITEAIERLNDVFV